MRRTIRASFALAVLLAAFGALPGCGQRGPLTLPGAARPSERLDSGKTAPAAGTQSAEPAAADAAPRPEDEERRNKE
jgi:predicted small lipoprotein YifL